MTDPTGHEGQRRTAESVSKTVLAFDFPSVDLRPYLERVAAGQLSDDELSNDPEYRGEITRLLDTLCNALLEHVVAGV